MASRFSIFAFRSRKCPLYIAIKRDPCRADDLRHLSTCLDDLHPKHRALVEQRYRQGRSLVELAEQVASTAGAVQVMLSRIRSALFDCIRRKNRRVAP